MFNTASTRTDTTPNMKNDDGDVFEFQNVGEKSPKGSDGFACTTEASPKNKTTQFGKLKVNYLHVPGIYNPKVFEMNDDIILQYETTDTEEGKSDSILMNKNAVNLFKTNVDQIITQ